MKNLRVGHKSLTSIFYVQLFKTIYFFNFFKLQVYFNIILTKIRIFFFHTDTKCLIVVKTRIPKIGYEHYKGQPNQKINCD